MLCREVCFRLSAAGIDPDVFRTYTHAALYTKRQIVRSLVDGVLKENLIRMHREGGASQVLPLL